MTARLLLTLLSALLFCMPLQAQRVPEAVDPDFPWSDSAGFGEVPVMPFSPGKCYEMQGFTVIDAQAEWDSIRDRWRGYGPCDNEEVHPFDFEAHSVIYAMAGGDCHATFHPRLYLNHEKKEARFVMTTRYGRCRAGKLADFWLRVPRIPAGYKVLYAAVGVDERSGARLKYSGTYR